MKDFLSDKEIEILSNHVRPETLNSCMKQLGKKDAQPRYERPNNIEVRRIAQLINREGSSLGLVVGVDSRTARRWQSENTKHFPTYSQWVLLCILAVKALMQDDQSHN